MNDWEFGTEREMREAVGKARKVPLSAKRVGQLVGGTVAVSLVLAAALLHFLLTGQPALAGYASAAFAGLFGGAWVGGRLAGLLRPSRPG